MLRDRGWAVGITLTHRGLFERPRWPPEQAGQEGSGAGSEDTPQGPCNIQAGWPGPGWCVRRGQGAQGLDLLEDPIDRI